MSDSDESLQERTSRCGWWTWLPRVLLLPQAQGGQPFGWMAGEPLTPAPCDAANAGYLSNAADRCMQRICCELSPADGHCGPHWRRESSGTGHHIPPALHRGAGVRRDDLHVSEAATEAKVA